MLFPVAEAALWGQGYVLDFHSKILKGTKINSSSYKDKIANGQSLKCDSRSVTANKFSSSGSLTYVIHLLEYFKSWNCEFRLE